MAEMTPENIRLKKLLAHVQNELLEQIDGGEETRGRDTWISGLIREIGHGLDTSYPFDIGPKIMQEAIRQAKQAAYERAAEEVEKYDEILIWHQLQFRHENIRDNVAAAIRALKETEG